MAIAESRPLDSILALDRNAIQQRYVNLQSRGRIRFVTFHQSLSYEDFVEGLKPVLGETGAGNEVAYQIQAGVFRELAAAAAESADRPAPQRNHVLIIDEINRGNVSRIFGELISLLEPDKRLGAPGELIVTLPYSRTDFGVPANLYLIGTMNTADRSVIALDAALRRRFRFTEVTPDVDLVRELNPRPIEFGRIKISVAEVMLMLNRRIEVLRNRDYQIGHSYFLKMTSPETVAEQFATGIIPLLREYFYEDYAQLRLLLGSGFVTRTAVNVDKLFPERFDVDEAGLPSLGSGNSYVIRNFRKPDGTVDVTGLGRALQLLLYGPSDARPV